MAEDSTGVLEDAERRGEETIEVLDKALDKTLDEVLVLPPGRAGTFLMPETVPWVEEGWNVMPEEEVPVVM